MKPPLTHTPDPSLDLLLERTVDVPVELVWKAWTTPDLIKQWFAPRPWSTMECEIDLRPGGRFKTVMCNPEGQEFPGEGCILEVVENSKLVWTSAMGPGYRPYVSGTGESHGGFVFTAIITLEAEGNQTKYSALVVHGDEESCKKHEAMGFYGGWATVLEQLVEVMQAEQGK